MSKPQQDQTWPLRPPLNVYPQQMYNMYQGHGMCQEICYQQPSRPNYMPRPYQLPYQSDSYRQAPQPLPQYVPVSPYTSRNFSQLQRHSLVHRPIPQNRYDYDYYPVNKSRSALKKPSNTHEYLHGNNQYPNNQYPACNVYPPQESESALRNIDVRQFLSTWQEKDEDTESSESHLKPSFPLNFEPLDCTKRDVPQNYHSIPYYNRNDAQNPPSSSSMYLQPYVNDIGDTNQPSMGLPEKESFIPYERSIEKIYNPRIYQDMPKNTPSNQCALSENMYLNQLKREEFKSQYHLSASLENDDMFDDINRKKEEKQKNVVHPLCHENLNEKPNFSPSKKTLPETISPFNSLENFNEINDKESHFSENLKRKFSESDVIEPAHKFNKESSEVNCETPYESKNEFSDVLSPSNEAQTNTHKLLFEPSGDSKSMPGLNHEFEISSEDIELSISSGDSLGIENTHDSQKSMVSNEPIDCPEKIENRSVLKVANESYKNLDNSKKSVLNEEKDEISPENETDSPESCIDSPEQEKSNALQTIAFCYQDLNLSEESSTDSRSFLNLKNDLKKVRKAKKILKRRIHFKPNSLLNWKIKHNLMPKTKDVNLFKKLSPKIRSKSKKKPQSDTLNILTECSEKNCEVNCVIYQSDEPQGDLNSILADEVQISGKCQDSINNNTTLATENDEKLQKIEDEKPIMVQSVEESKLESQDESDDKKLRNVIANFFTAGKLKIDSDLTCSFDERELVNQIIIKGGEEVGSAKWHFKNIKTVSQKESIKCSLTWEKIFKSLYEQNDVFKKDSLELGPAKIFLTLSPKAGQVQEKFLKDTNLNVFKATINARKLILKRNDCEGRIPKMVIKKSEGLGYRSFIKDSIALQNEKNEPENQSQVVSFKDNQSVVDTDLKKEVHHCILCQKSFTSIHEFQDHESSKNHRHLDIVQRNAVHKIYNAAFGSDHPHCRPLSDLDKEFLNWKPHFPGFKHNYHYALP